MVQAEFANVPEYAFCERSASPVVLFSEASGSTATANVLAACSTPQSSGEAFPTTPRLVIHPDASVAVVGAVPPSCSAPKFEPEAVPLIT